MSMTARLREMMGRGTPGPWRAIPCPEWKNGKSDIRNDDREWACFGEIAHAGPHDAELIVAAINALPALLKVVEAADKARSLLIFAPDEDGENRDLDDCLVNVPHRIDQIRKLLTEALAAVGGGGENG